MHLEVISPDKKLFDNEVNIVTFPGEDGIFQVLNHHAPMIATLKQGALNYRGKDIDTTLQITGGVVEIAQNKVTVLIESLNQ